MRIGGPAVSTKAAGMSALWHDVDFVPPNRIDVPTVERGLEDMPLPSEEQKLPDGFADPFLKQDGAYEMAAEQMERGIKGVEFLYGKKPVNEASPATVTTSGAPAPTSTTPAERPVSMSGAANGAKGAQAGNGAAHETPQVTGAAMATPIDVARDVTRTMVANQDLRVGNSADRRQDSIQGVDNREVSRRVSQADELAQLGGPQSSTGNSAATKKAGDAAQALAVGVVGTLAGQGFDPVNSANAMVQEGAKVIQAVTASKLAVGMTQGIKDAPEPIKQTERDGLQQRVHGFDPLDDDDKGGF